MVRIGIGATIPNETKLRKWPGLVTKENILQESAMLYRWRSAIGGPVAGHGMRDHDAGHIGGWAISGLMTLAAILLTWHFQI